MTGILYAVFVVLISLVIASAIPILHLVLAFAHRRSARLADEAAVLAAPLPPENALPRVLVQLPVYNEPAVVQRAIVAIAALDWPRDRLALQVLDDSTDDTTALARAAVEDARRRGIDAALIHRDTRAGFKAGALAHGLAQSDAPFVAIFDADYCPARDWLGNAMRPVLADERLAFVQSRITHRNRGDNALTRAQGVLLDLHYAFEQPARAWAGLPIQFNGTCALWRRDAIDTVGGWSADTLAEDFDLSLRAQRAGWRARLMATLTVAGELPAEDAQWRAQQYRWSKGTAQALMKILRRAPALAGTRLFLFVAAALAECLLPLLIATTLAVGVVLLALMGEPSLTLAILVNAAFLLHAAVRIAAVAESATLAGRPRAGVIADAALALWFELRISAGRMRATLSGLAGRRSDFVRTEKQGV